MDVMIEVGVYSKYSGIEPTVLLGQYTPTRKEKASDLLDFINELREGCERILGAPAEDDAVFIRIFKQ